jgi:hypothetical protein
VTEQLRFEECLGYAGAIDRDKGPVGAVALGMNRACDDFLAGAALARNQDLGIGARDAVVLFMGSPSNI